MLAAVVGDGGSEETATRVDAATADPVAALARAEADRATALAAVLEGQERIRSGIAASLHDGPIQVLTAASLRLGLLRRHVEGATADQVAETEQLITQSITSLRAEMNDLRSAADIAETLGDALTAYLARTGHAELFEVVSEGDLAAGEPLAVVAYRAVQTLARAAGGSPAPRRVIRIRAAADGTPPSVVLPVADAGQLAEQVDLWTRVLGGRAEVVTGPDGTALVLGGSGPS
jgi:signal transduction histidine kinase